MTTNWATEPVEEVPAGGLVRLRVAATDTARIYKLFLPGAQGLVIALDGHPLAVPLPLPVSDAEALLLAPGQRADLAIAMPPTEGATVDLMTHAPGKPRLMARLLASGGTLKRELTELKPLAPNDIPEPELDKARVEELVFGWSPRATCPTTGSAARWVIRSGRSTGYPGRAMPPAPALWSICGRASR
ncbi:hypothetical protein ACFSZS_13170 [Seohaeicola zhoushanensis]